MRQDLEYLFKAALIVLGTVLLTGVWPEWTGSHPWDPTFIGLTLMMIALATYVIATNYLVEPKQPARLSPPGQLTIWLLGVMGALLGTQGLRRLEPTVDFWLIYVVMLTYASRDGWRWLLRQAWPLSKARN